MTKEVDRWPLPKFDAGDARHLHAVGVIAVTFAQFERGIESLFLHHPAQLDVQTDLIQRYYFALNEEQRIKVTRTFYRDREADELVRAAISNALDFFDWAHDARNKILHSEKYPIGFGGNPDVFYLTKRAGKRDPKSTYLALSLDQLRGAAENMRRGIVLAAEINIHVRYRHLDLSKIEESLRVYAKTPPSFALLPIPEKLIVTDYPSYHPLVAGSQNGG
jgi:hypothetical protein